jgi:hypothetical protein
MRCSRPTRVRGLHHQRGQPQVIVLTPWEGMATPPSNHTLITHQLYRASESPVCSILHIFLGKEESKVESSESNKDGNGVSATVRGFRRIWRINDEKDDGNFFRLYPYLIFGVAHGQDPMNHDDVQRTYESQTPIQLAGTISDTGETFVSDKGGKSWTIINPDAVKGHKGSTCF